MNSKFYVPFETAKMLEAQGYPQSSSDMYYNPNGELKTQVELIAGYKEDYPIMIKYYTAAPAYCEVLDWLNGIGYPIQVKWKREHSDIVWFCEISQRTTDTYPTREQAINAAIIIANAIITLKGLL